MNSKRIKNRSIFIVIKKLESWHYNERYYELLAISILYLI